MYLAVALGKFSIIKVLRVFGFGRISYVICLWLGRPGFKPTFPHFRAPGVTFSGKYWHFAIGTVGLRCRFSTLFSVKTPPGRYLLTWSGLRVTRHFTSPRVVGFVVVTGGLNSFISELFGQIQLDFRILRQKLRGGVSAGCSGQTPYHQRFAGFWFLGYFLCNFPFVAAGPGSMPGSRTFF